MRKITILLVALAIILPLLHARAELTNPHQLTLQEKKFDFEQLINQVRLEYGPLQYKKAVMGIDLNELAKKYWEIIKNTKDNGEFYSTIIQFAAEFKDGHFLVLIPTSLKASVPFSTFLLGDKVVIEDIDRSELPEKTFPFQRGDEITAVNGTPINVVLNKLMTYRSLGKERSSRAYAAYNLTLRAGKLYPVPEGDVVFTIRSGETGAATDVPLEWKISGESFDEHKLSSTQAMTMLSKDSFSQYNFPTVRSNGPGLLSDLDLYQDLIAAGHASYKCSGITRIEIPEDATVLQEEPFTIYYHPTERGNVGYLRIPHYYPEAFGQGTYPEWLETIEWALAIMEKETVGLIIDQDHNCGGEVLFTEDIVALFMDHEFTGQPFRYRASKKEILGWKQYINKNFRPNTRVYDGHMQVVDLMTAALNEGLFMTPLTTERGYFKMLPKNVYTKPVVVLTDYMSGSGGDAFPAMMQGLGCAKIIGSTTSGLGGHVDSSAPLTYSRMTVNLTQSLDFHPDGTPIENNGVSPDVPYEITMNDFLNGFKDYQAFYLNELFKMID